MPRVLLLHTGGTLGMRGEPLEPGLYNAQLLEDVPQLLEIAEVETRVVCNLDSSDVGPEQWSTLARIIASEYRRFDGFVVIHGTDTMSYSASALTFALEGLAKPVIFTGAQRPLSAIRTDARRNLLDAVELAIQDIPEVGICFDGLLLRGCRSRKSNAHDYRAFGSPGCAPLARLGVDVELGNHIRRPGVPFRCDPRFDPHVIALHLTPGFRAEMLAGMVSASPTLRGIVLSVFGVGTVPTLDEGLATALREADEKGIEIVATTPSAGRIDFSQYANSSPLILANVIPGGSMQLEAATTKLMHGLAVCDSRASLRTYMEWNVAGEMA